MIPFRLRPRSAARFGLKYGDCIATHSFLFKAPVLGSFRRDFLHRWRLPFCRFHSRTHGNEPSAMSPARVGAEAVTFEAARPRVNFSDAGLR